MTSRDSWNLSEKDAKWSRTATTRCNCSTWTSGIWSGRSERLCSKLWRSCRPGIKASAWCRYIWCSTKWCANHSEISSSWRSIKKERRGDCSRLYWSPWFSEQRWRCGEGRPRSEQGGKSDSAYSLATSPLSTTASKKLWRWWAISCTRAQTGTKSSLACAPSAVA